MNLLFVSGNSFRVSSRMGLFDFQLARRPHATNFSPLLQSKGHNTIWYTRTESRQVQQPKARRMEVFECLLVERTSVCFPNGRVKCSLAAWLFESWVVKVRNSWNLLLRICWLVSMVKNLPIRVFVTVASTSSELDVTALVMLIMEFSHAHDRLTWMYQKETIL